MNIRLKYLVGIMAIVFIACEPEAPEETSILGEWNFEFQITEDGTRDFTEPYTLVEFEYSDAFILREDGTGSTKWFGSVNGSFDWEREGDELDMIVPGSGEEAIVNTFLMSSLTDSSMIFNTPKGFTYQLVKVD